MQASYVEIRVILRNIYFSLTKQELIQQAIKHGASNEVIEDLRSIQDKEYISLEVSSWNLKYEINRLW
ncbi:DUF2795 domain-containing protein [Methanosarcina sp. UBA5]|uniref:DUF2795 domain-containing protein n=1 Tax=Methanosarcina sp. UBA5 TaxID=1915593 RepID=UPI003742F1A0